MRYGLSHQRRSEFIEEKWSDLIYMRRSFYHYLMTLKGPAKDPRTDFAMKRPKIFSFPKQTEDYHELSSYLEMNADYLSNMDIFDELWEKYLENNK